MEFEEAEAPGALEAEDIAVVQMEKEVLVLPPGDRGGLHPDHAGHAEVHEKGPLPRDFGGEVAPPAADGDELRPFEVRLQERREGRPHGGGEHLHAHDASAGEPFLKSPADISASGTGGPTTVSLIRRMITLTYTLNTMTAAASGSKRRRRAR